MLLGPDSGGLSQVCANVWRDDDHPGVRAPVLRAGRRQQNKTAQSHGGCFRRPRRRTPSAKSRPPSTGSMQTRRRRWSRTCSNIAPGSRKQSGRWRTRPRRKPRRADALLAKKSNGRWGRLEDIRRTESQPRDSRILPAHYAPVMVMENGQRVVKPMRYQCRIAGKPASYDAKYRALTSRAATVLKVIGSRFLAIRMALSWQALFMSMRAARSWRNARLQTAKRTKTWFSNSARTRLTRCSSPACGRTGRRPGSRVSRTYCRLQLSRTSRRLR